MVKVYLSKLETEKDFKTIVIDDQAKSPSKHGADWSSLLLIDLYSDGVVAVRQDSNRKVLSEQFEKIDDHVEFSGIEEFTTILDEVKELLKEIR